MQTCWELGLIIITVNLVGTDTKTSVLIRIIQTWTKNFLIILDCVLQHSKYRVNILGFMLYVKNIWSDF